MSVSDIIALYGALITAMSIVIVYHAMTLQMWLSRVGTALEEAMIVAITTRGRDVERVLARSKVNLAMDSFPRGSVAYLGVGFFVMVCVCFSLCWMVREQNGLWLRLAMPLLVLSGVYVASTIVARRDGAAKTAQALDHLGQRD